MKPFDPDSWPDMIALSYQQLSEARQGLYDALVSETTEKIALERDRGTLILRGLTGKNAEEREANLRDALAERYAAVELASAQVAQERLQYDLGSFEVERLKLTIRAMELEARS